MKKKTRQPERRRWQNELMDAIEQSKSNVERMMFIRTEILMKMVESIPDLLDSSGIPQLEFVPDENLEKYLEDFTGTPADTPKLKLQAEHDGWIYTVCFSKIALNIETDKKSVNPGKLTGHVKASVDFFRTDENKRVEYLLDGKWVD